MRTTDFSRGTGGYRAPELIKENSKYNNKVDIWALGCILYELVVGQTAFNNDWNLLEFVQSKRSIRPSSDGLIDRTWVREITSLFDDMFQLEPEMRDRASNLCRRFAFNHELMPSTTFNFESSAYSYEHGRLYFDFRPTLPHSDHRVSGITTTGGSCCIFPSHIDLMDCSLGAVQVEKVFRYVCWKGEGR